jgi:chaperonin GroES
MRIQPFNDQVIIRRVAATVTSGGLHIPERASDREPERSAIRGEVVAVGPGHRRPDGSRQEVEVLVGQQVFFRTYAGTEVELNGDKLLVLSADDLLAVVVE